MDSRQEKRAQRNKVDSILSLIEDSVANDLSEVAEKTEVKYLKDGEIEWLIRRESPDYDPLSLGYPLLDKVTGGLLPGELMVVGGDTGHGKSIFAMNVGYRVYKNSGKPILMVNLELTEDQARERFYSLSEEEDGSHDYDGIIVQKASAVSYRDIDVLMKRAKEEDVCLVIIDHLHFFSRSQDNTTGELSRIMKHFKECAVANELPVMLLSHVTPKREYGESGEVTKVHKPGLHNLKGSSSIEQDADIVSFVFRNQTDTSKLEFYVRKMRSRELITETVTYTQNGWKLEEQWWPLKGRV